MTRWPPDRRFVRHAWICVPLLTASSGAAQQAATGLPSREQIAPAVPAAPTGQPKVTIDDRSARPPCDLAPSAEEIDLRAAEFASADGTPLPAEIRVLLAPIRPTAGLQPVSGLCALRDRAAEALRVAGYIAAVSIPPQDIDGGIARLDVILAHFADVRLTGRPGRYARRLAPRLAEIKALRPVNQRELERMLLAIDDIPGLSITLTLRPAGTGTGAILGELAVDHDPVGLVAALDNLGSQAIGPVNATSRVEAYGLTGLYDRSYLGASIALGGHEQRVVQLGHYIGNGRRLTLGARFSYAWTRPSLPGFDIRSRSAVGGIDLSRQLLRSPEGELRLGAGLDITDQRARILVFPFNVPIRTRDELRVAYLRLSGSAQRGRHMLNGQVELRRGLAILGASSSGSTATSRPGADSTATVVRATIEDVIAWGPAFSLAGTIDGQWASGPLLGFEQYAIGNYTIGRGYDPGAASADRALGVRLEPRLDLFANGNPHPQIFAFADHVRIWKAGAGNPSGRFTSFGGGLRLIGPPAFAIEALYAHRPGNRTVATGTSKASDRLLASIAFRF
ncbi:ShlB/FhaC/HecB family hemolysin secretion/activation protein [Rhizorhabdus dicambivorans]|uniref:ShlB/FhaC/HecB family hemolysin secretion/activation protein n=1 Tax=Rhizorhabdus dicambivorans TaxID=1850238 RepID=A0A2A4FYD0_9SPHN|nr:ShlB/FhaC/HecB family hemolysin secretion/activation protein [Rhizorhabdus dicambivorans]ATE63587.1 ShlB/FhaC/HecB family hemolysin secretion/activation protein [Rhizorhabdus dicambivorans]PCE42713.1 ShlB/FhaC/HecB family hemolysin secretion/activation protein [Rhizorhabdus dicambivorans]